MSNHLVKYLMQEKGINLSEAEMISEERKNFRRYFKDLDFLELSNKNKEVKNNG